MNIFVLDKNPKRCAQYHNDKHVVKMLLEHTQMMCTVLNEQGFQTPYKSTHIHQPCTVWLRQSKQNWEWLKAMTSALNDEYKRRYFHIYDHKSFRILKELPEPNLPDIGLTPFAQAMPEHYRDTNPVKAYRSYYMGDKRSINQWKTTTPSWYS